MRRPFMTWTMNRRLSLSSYLSKRYGLSLHDYVQMIVDQDGRCALCRRPFTAKPAVDHCHKTGQVRGLLCRSCNVGLGNFKDSPTLLEKAIKYLKDNKLRDPNA